jgi:general secretion pathway protein C
MRLRLPVARIVSLLLFAALCAIVAGWALQLLAPRAPIAPAGAVAQAQPPSDLSATGQLFGGLPRAADAVAEAPSNIQVAGVIAAGPRGVALLSIDGRPAKPFAVGEPVADGMKVRSVSGDEVELERAGQPMRLAAPARASLAVLTSGPQRPTGGAASGAAPPPPGLPPLPPRTLPPAGAAAPVQESVPAQAGNFAPSPPPIPANVQPSVAPAAPAAAPAAGVPPLPGVPPTGAQ